MLVRFRESLIFIRRPGLRYKYYAYKKNKKPSFTEPKFPTDISYYQNVEISHLHEWKYKDAKGEFENKMKAYENKKNVRCKESTISIPLEIRLHRPKIEIPTRISRSPSELLRAISQSLERDASAPNHIFQDDPFLTPRSQIDSRDCMYSLSSGKEAARYVFDQHYELFENNQIEMVPSIPAFMPKFSVTKKNVSLEALDIYLAGSQFENASVVYRLLKEKGVKIESGISLQLFELLSYHGQLDESLESLKDSIAEEIKDEYSLQIKLCKLLSFSKIGDYNRAKSIFDSLSPSELGLEGFNAYFQIFSAQLTSFSELQNQIVSNLRVMNQFFIKPNALTLYYLLDSIASYIKELNNLSSFKGAQNLAASLYVEFSNSLHIVPSAGSFDALLRIFCSKGHSETALCVFKEILETLSSAQLELRHPNEPFFFDSAMGIVSSVLCDSSSAHALHKHLTSQKHTAGIALCNSFKELNYYYNQYLISLLNHGRFKDAMEFYNQNTPNIFQINIYSAKTLLRKVRENGAYEFLPSLWLDLMASKFLMMPLIPKFELIDTFLTLGLESIVTEDVLSFNQKILSMASDAFLLLSNLNRFLSSPHLTHIVESIILISLEKSDETPNVSLLEEILDFVEKKGKGLNIGVLKPATLQLLTSFSIQEGHKALATQSVIYAAHNDLANALDLASKVLSSLKLSKQQIVAFNSLFSHKSEWSQLKESSSPSDN